MLNLKLMLMPQSTMVDTMDTPVPMDMVCTTVDTMVDTTDTPMPPVMAAVTTVMVDTDMDVSDTDGRFSQNLFKLFQNCIHPETKKMFFNIKTQEIAYNLYVEKHLT